MLNAWPTQGRDALNVGIISSAVIYSNASYCFVAARDRLFLLSAVLLRGFFRDYVFLRVSFNARFPI